ncbi:hypothetical protein CAOG_07472 [Capsaspora owczarzaki ATCC 30864]|uniref:GRAM domain-containing protein n=1 Tax=Capsaspora owczarzaki (strain ATCC 30864) TaxID=595528 RepID=A0A0D2VYY6_CAPO3|nr:hypothetical protein CAOG_07472 [Capsaspora owczarzaki ATCC 30864]KJE96982.1 hypothetical protein CAOG_007472 [Capsaspora owczarzaki ATCC 30864]|eukprot:XP_004343346.2 hypothetical protein CAOG_07472 [Capsaspora owczarzaki ATCC 30864]
MSAAGGGTGDAAPDKRSSSAGLSNEIFEQQLAQLEDQLVDAMMGKQAMEDEVARLKERTHELENQLAVALSSSEAAAQPNSPAQRARTSTVGGRGVLDASASDSTQPKRPSSLTLSARVAQLQANIIGQWRIFLDDLKEEQEDDMVVVTAEPDVLSMKLLKLNVARFRAAFRPIKFTIDLVSHVLTWSNPAATAIICVTMWLLVLSGILIPVLLLAMAGFLTYMYYLEAGVTKLRPFGYTDEPVHSGEPDPSMRDRVTLMLSIARRVQNLLGDVATVLEKLANLVTWKNPTVTRKLRNMLLIGGIGMLVLPDYWIGFLVGTNVCLQLFVLKHLFRKFPKLRAKYDTVPNMFAALPSAADVAAIHAPTGASGSRSATIAADAASLMSEDGISLDGRADAEAAELKQSKKHRKEHLLRDQFGFENVELIGNWRCALLNKASKYTGHRQGKLYLTARHLCFDPASGFFSSASEKDKLLIDLADIVTIRKAKPISFSPGDGFSIEVILSDSHSILFGALVRRDVTFETIAKQGASLALDWGTAALASIQEPPKSK